MEVSSYNEGRSVQEVAAKTWVDGTRYLFFLIIQENTCDLILCMLMSVMWISH